MEARNSAAPNGPSGQQPDYGLTCQDADNVHDFGAAEACQTARDMRILGLLPACLLP